LVTAAESQSPSSGLRPRLLLILAGLSGFGALTTDVYLPGFPQMTADLDVGATAGQLTLTSCVVGLALGQLVIGPLSDMTGRRRPLLLCLAGFTLASIGCVLAPTLPVLVGARFLQGICGAGGIVVARAMVRDLVAGIDAAHVYSTLSAIVTSGPIFAPLIGGSVLLIGDWRGIFAVLALVGVALFGATLRLTEETLPPERRRSHALRQTLGSIRVLLGHRRYMGFVLAGAFGFGTIFAYISASSFVYQDVFGMSAQLYSVLFAVNGFALMSSSFVNGRLVRRFTPEPLLRVGLAAITFGSAAVSAAVVVGAGVGVVQPLLFLTVGSVGLVISNGVAMAMSGEPSRAGAASALFGLFQFSVGGAIAPLVGIEGTSAIPMGVAMVGCASIASASYLWLCRSS
jgi:DHA1 family bicyclomycin/chloramphenicol resistance-like MFS transporter